MSYYNSENVDYPTNEDTSEEEIRYIKTNFDDEEECTCGLCIFCLPGA